MKKILSFLKKSTLVFASMLSLSAYAQTPVTYTVVQYSNTLPSDAVSVDLKIFPVNFGDGVNVDFIGSWATDVTITDSENNNLGGSSPVTSITDGSGCDFTVNFDNAQIASDIAAAMTNNICYMVSFKEGSLQYDNGSTQYTNKFPVTAYLYFWDAVDFATTPQPAFEAICEQTTTLNIAVTGRGHHLPSVIYTGGIELNGTPKATITGTDINGNAVNVEAAITGGAGSFTLTFDSALPQDNGTNYTVTVPANAFKASQSKSPVFTYELDVLSHPAYTLTAPADMDPKNTFTVPVAVAGDHAGETIEIALAAGSSNVVTISNGTNTYNGTAAYAAGVATVTTTDKIAAGDYTVTFAAGNFKANLCESEVLTTTLHVEDIVWTYTPATVMINDATTTFNVTVGATFEGNPVAITDQTLTVSLNGTTATLTFVSEDPTTLVRTYTVTLASTISADDNLTIAAGSVKAMNSDNVDKIIPIQVVPYVYYSIDTEEIMIDTKDTEFTFTLYTKDGSNATLDRLISNVGETDPALQSTSNAVAFNDGFASVYPTLSFPENNKVTATFGSSLPANNYQLNIPKHTVYADANDNDNKMFVNFRVMNHIEISVAPAHECVASGATTATIQLKGYDTDDAQDATVNVKLKDGAVPTIDGVAVTSCVAGSQPGEYVVTFPALAEGTHVVKFAAGDVVANASKNAAVLEYTINVEDFVAENVTINQMDTEFDVKVSDEAVTVLAGATADINGTTVTLSNATEAGYIHVTMPAELTKGTYTLTISAAHETASFEGAYAHQYEDLTCTVDVINEFFFVDNCAPKVTTTAADVVAANASTGATYDKLHYTRKFGNAGVQQLALPFSIDYDDVAADVDLYRIAMVHYLTDADGELVLTAGGEKQLVIELKKMKSGDKTVANMPYVVKSKVAGATVDWTFANKAMVDPAVASLKMNTAFNTFDVKTTTTSTTTVMDADVQDAIICSGSAFKFNTAGGSIRAWSWYGALGDNKIENTTYVKVAIDGELFEDGEATGIATLFTESANNAIYNVAGQKLNSAAKGINIINGKKVLVK